MRVYELSLKSENFSDLRIPVSALYLSAAPSTPSEAVDDVIEHARSGERQAHAEIKDKIDKFKTAKAGSSDITARLIGQWLSEHLGQHVYHQAGIYAGLREPVGLERPRLWRQNDPLIEVPVRSSVMTVAPSTTKVRTPPRSSK